MAQNPLDRLFGTHPSVSSYRIKDEDPYLDKKAREWRFKKIKPRVVVGLSCSEQDAVYQYGKHRVLKVGPFRAEAPATVAQRQGLPKKLPTGKVEYWYEGKVELVGAMNADPRQRFDEPIPGGVSYGEEHITAGTLAGVVWRDGEPVLLTNAHVAGFPNLAPGAIMVQPGPIDGGTQADQVGIHLDHGMNHPDLIDAAIARIEGGRSFSEDAWLGLGTLPRIAPVEPTPGDHVAASGRYQALPQVTGGQVIGIGVSVNVGWPDGTTRTHQNVYSVYGYGTPEGVPPPGGFVEGGKSGSYVANLDQGNGPLGLIFAGSLNGTGYVVPALAIQAVLGVTFAQSGEPAPEPPPVEGKYGPSSLRLNGVVEASLSESEITGSLNAPDHVYHVGDTISVVGKLVKAGTNDGLTDRMMTGAMFVNDEHVAQQAVTTDPEGLFTFDFSAQEGSFEIRLAFSGD